MSLLKSAGNIYFAYQFLTKLTKPFDQTDAFKLGIIDEKGKVLKKRKTLKSQEEKDAYTISDTLIFKSVSNTIEKALKEIYLTNKKKTQISKRRL